MSGASRRASEQMRRDGISKLPRFGPPSRQAGYTLRAVVRHDCEQPGCSKRAGYQTPAGKRCFAHVERQPAPPPPATQT